MVADGMTADEIVAELPPLELADVEAALRYAADAVLERELPLRKPALNSSSIRTAHRWLRRHFAEPDTTLSTRSNWDSNERPMWSCSI